MYFCMCLGEPADSAVQSSTGDVASGVALERQSLDEVNLLRSSG